MTKITRSFIIRFYNDEHGMKGTFSSVQEAVDHINQYYRDSKAMGVDCKGGRWIVVCEDRTRITNGGAFLREEIHRYTVATFHYSEKADAFVSEEVSLQSVD
jgi:hypothetical protein